MASSHQEELHEQGQEDKEGEDHDHHQITAPLLRPSTSRGSPEEGEGWEAENSTVEQVALTVPVGDDPSTPVEQVALTVPVGDDPSTPVLTFRMWVLGATACVALSFLNTFFGYRKEPLEITAISAQVAVVPLGRLMAAALPERAFFRGRRWEFTLNPGPFNVIYCCILIQ